VRSLRGGANRFNRDGHVYPINAPIEDYRLFVVLINVQKKPFSSREAMRRTVLTSSLYKPFVDTANRDADALEAALKNGDFKTVGKLSEKSALSMHGTLLASNPPIQFLLRDSIKVIESIKRLREDEGIGAFFTMDAGPNIKVLTTHKDVERLQRALKSLDHEILGPLTPSMEGAHIL
jgi:diphosphomevalonate decarboxylase